MWANLIWRRKNERKTTVSLKVFKFEGLIYECCHFHVSALTEVFISLQRIKIVTMCIFVRFLEKLSQKLSLQDLFFNGILTSHLNSPRTLNKPLTSNHHILLLIICIKLQPEACNDWLSRHLTFKQAHLRSNVAVKKTKKLANDRGLLKVRGESAL